MEERDDHMLALRDFMENVQTIGGSAYSRALYKRDKDAVDAVDAAAASAPPKTPPVDLTSLPSSSAGFLFLPLSGTDPSAASSSKLKDDKVAPIRQTLFFNIEAPSGGHISRFDIPAATPKEDTKNNKDCNDDTKKKEEEEQLKQKQQEERDRQREQRQEDEQRQKIDGDKMKGNDTDEIGARPKDQGDQAKAPPGASPPPGEDVNLFKDEDRDQGRTNDGAQETIFGKADPSAAKPAEGQVQGDSPPSSFPPSLSQSLPPSQTQGQGPFKPDFNQDGTQGVGPATKDGQGAGPVGQESAAIDGPSGEGSPLAPPIDPAAKQASPATGVDPSAAAMTPIKLPDNVDQSNKTKIVFKPLAEPGVTLSNDPSAQQPSPPDPNDPASSGKDDINDGEKRPDRGVPGGGPDATDYSAQKAAGKAIGQGAGDASMDVQRDSAGEATRPLPPVFGANGGAGDQMRPLPTVFGANNNAAASSQSPTSTTGLNAVDLPTAPTSTASPSTDPLASTSPSQQSSAPVPGVADASMPPPSSNNGGSGAKDYFIYPVEDKHKTVDLNQGDMVAYVDKGSDLASDSASQAVGNLLNGGGSGGVGHSPVPPPSTPTNDQKPPLAASPQPAPSFQPTKRTHPRMWNLVRRGQPIKEAKAKNEEATWKEGKNGKNGKEAKKGVPMKMFTGRRNASIKYYSGDSKSP
ncbi:hypothetical protein CBS101457_004459 [Exobasidium rhododendri]|nr:hypothetical protein CBS101457_004459 [Exobasidium rhododendri]